MAATTERMEVGERSLLRARLRVIAVLGTCAGENGSLCPVAWLRGMSSSWPSPSEGSQGVDFADLVDVGVTLGMYVSSSGEDKTRGDSSVESLSSN